MGEERQLGLFGDLSQQGSWDDDVITVVREHEREHVGRSVVPPAPWDRVPDRKDLADLAAVAQAVERCRACRLGETRTRSVPGEGNPDADLMFIGEGPGVEEDLQGRPFVGAAGRLLDKIIAAMGMSRDQVFIGNIVKCRPPYNRVPESAEIEACLPFLARQIRLIRPRIIVLLGATALRALVDPGASITRARGQWIRVANTMIMPTFHPAALLRDPAKKRPLWEDMQRVLEQLKDPLRRGEE